MKSNFNFTIKSWQFILIYALFTLVAYNWSLFDKLSTINSSLLFCLGGGFIAFTLLTLALSLLFCSPRSTKIIAIFLSILNSIALYFMSSYNILIDKIMLLNVIRTDIYEAGEVLRLPILWYILCGGILPAWLIIKTNIQFSPLMSELKTRLKLNLINIIISTIIIFPQVQNNIRILDEHKELRYAFIPSNYIGAGIGILKMYDELTRPYTPISTDARVEKYWHNDKKNLFVLVVGETARAANFSLGGYPRPTNAALTPYLDQLVYYKDFYACGTSTAVAVPCMFSKYSQAEFKEGSELNTGNLLDVFASVGYHGLWIDNNTSCQDNCNRIELQSPCTGKFCQDDILIQDLAPKLRSINRNTFLVLHQKGSHGPDYYNRYPQNWEAPYSPICRDKNPANCSRQELINAYDNSIAYTSIFLKNTIDILNQLSNEYNVILFYASDHGESLGENGIYLHAAPYDSAPLEQLHIPAFIWMPQSSAQAFGVDINCLKRQASSRHSHDNIFHSFLGLGGIQTQDYQKSLDIFATCRRTK